VYYFLKYVIYIFVYKHTLKNNTQRHHISDGPAMGDSSSSDGPAMVSDGPAAEEGPPLKARGETRKHDSEVPHLLHNQAFMLPHPLRPRVL
jgi:hypothetical protein